MFYTFHHYLISWYDEFTPQFPFLTHFPRYPPLPTFSPYPQRGIGPIYIVGNRSCLQSQEKGGGDMNLCYPKQLVLSRKHEMYFKTGREIPSVMDRAGP